MAMHQWTFCSAQAMSALGQKQTFTPQKVMSALGQKQTFAPQKFNVRFTPRKRTLIGDTGTSANCQ